MKLDHPVPVTSLAALAAAPAAVRAWMDTLDYRVVFYDPDVDPASPRCRGQKIYVFWHEYILLPLAMRGHCNLAMLLSRHRDAEILSYVAYHMGFEFVAARPTAAAWRPCGNCWTRAGTCTWRSRPTAPADRGGKWPPGRSSWPRNWEFRWWPWALATIGPGGPGVGTALPSRGLQPGPLHPLAGVARPARPGSRRAGAFPPEGRAGAESALRRGRAVGRSRQPQAGPIDAARAVKPLAPRRRSAGLGWCSRSERTCHANPTSDRT